MKSPENFTGTPKENLRTTRILCFALITGVIFFAFLSYLVNKFSGAFINETKQYSNIFFWALGIVSFICILVATQKYPKNITKSKNADSLIDKLNQYRAALVIYMALCEGPALFSVVVYMLTGNLNSFGFTIIMIGMMLVKFPTSRKVNNELGLNWQEQQELE